jgi:hypothetical protein
MGMRWLILLLIGASFASALVAACTHEIYKPPPAGDSRGSSGVVGNGGGVEGGVVIEAGPLPDAGNQCSAIANSATVADTDVAEDITPAIGGVVAPGTFVLIQHNNYTGVGGKSGPTGNLTASALAFDGTNYQEVGAKGNVDGGIGKDDRHNGTYTFDKTTFTRDSKCGIGPIPVAYSINGDVLRLSFLNDEYVYMRR